MGLTPSELEQQRRNKIREIEEMHELRRPTSEEVACRSEWNEFVKSYEPICNSRVSVEDRRI